MRTLLTTGLLGTVLALAPSPAGSAPAPGDDLFNNAARIDTSQVDDRTAPDPDLGSLLLGVTR